MKPQKLTKNGLSNLVKQLVTEAFYPEKQIKNEEIFKEVEDTVEEVVNKLPEEVFTESSEEESEQEFITEEELEQYKPIFESKIIAPMSNINESSKWLAIIFKNGNVEDNNYFDTEKDAAKWTSKFI